DKDKIADITEDRVTKINRVFINPSNCRTAPGVVDAIKDADAIILGPGSLYTNVIPNLLIKNVAKSIRESKAFKIYIPNNRHAFSAV
ncbi:MAG: 2-phospho-L-lactate transferase CofD family protein, partial [Candidatus Fimenecus sp.]